MKTLTKYFVVFLTLCAFFTAQAQEDQQKQPSEWEFIIEPFGLAGSLNGDIALGLHGPYEFEMTFHDILEHLKIAGFVHVEIQKGNWGVMFDYVGMKVGEDIQREKFNRVVVLDANLKKSVADLVVNYRFKYNWGFFDLYAGARMWHMNLKLKLEDEFGVPYEDRDSSENERWTDPVVGSRIMFKNPDSRWFFAFRADIGGFGAASKFTYNFEPGLGYQFSDLLTGTLKFRYLNGDYDNDEELEDHFSVDVTLKGPSLGLQFTF